MKTTLYHLTHIQNLPGIAKRGLLCRKRIQAQGVPYLDLSDPSCQARRTHKYLGGTALDLQGYVPLFLNPRNPMLYRLLRTLEEWGEAGYLAILEISFQPASWATSLIADGIASSGETQLFHARDPRVVDALDWNVIQEDSWAKLPRNERRKTMAEVLVRGGLKQRHIKKVWVQQPSALQILAGELSPSDLSCCQVDSQNTLFYP
jgi:hypothetical protein